MSGARVATSGPPTSCPSCGSGLENLRAHKLRSLLTMLGMIFGVAAVVAMLSIGAGAQQEVMAFIEQLGVRNLIVEAREAADEQTLQKVRKLSAGLVVQGPARHPGEPRRHHRGQRAQALHADRSCCRGRIGGDMPVVYGVSPGLHDDRQPARGVGPVLRRGGDGRRRRRWRCSARPRRRRCSAPTIRLGSYVKVNEQWFQVIGVAGPQLTVQSDVAGLPAQDRNNLIYVPLYSSIFRLEDGQSAQKDEIDGIYLQMKPGADIPAAAALLRGILDVAHRGAGDFTIVSPAELLAEQRRTQRDLRNGDGGDRVDLAARRRHRHHEHHAGQRARAHARDRRPPRHRRARSATSSASS